MEVDYGGFSIREYTRHIRSVEVRKCWPFSGDVTGDLIHSLLPPITVAKFRWWSHELASLLTKSPVTPDDSGPGFRRKAKTPCRKRSVAELARREDERDDDSAEVLIGSKRKKTNEEAREKADNGKCRIGIEERSGVMSPSRKKKKKKPGVRCLSYTEEEIFPDSPKSLGQDWDSEFQIPGIYASQSKRQVRFSDNGIFSLEQCCLDMNRLSLFAAEDQSSVGDKKTVAVSNDQISNKMQFQRFWCSPGPHPSQERIEDALDLERKRNLTQPIQSFEGCKSFDRSSVGTGYYSVSASAENEPAITKDGISKIPVHSERRLKYFPARLGIDESFTEKGFFVSDSNVDGGECGQNVHYPVPEANPMSHTLILNQNLDSRDMVANGDDGLCLYNTEATMRLMGKDVSVGTSYSDFVRAGQRTIAPDGPFLGSHTHQSWLRRGTTLGVSEHHSTTSMDKNWSRNLLCNNTSKDAFPFFREPLEGRTAVVPDSEFPTTVLYPCGSLVSCPWTDKDISFHGYGLGQQLNSFTFSQQQLLPFHYNPVITGLPCDYNNVGIGLLPDARKPYFTCTDFTRQAQPHWPQNSFETSRSDMSFINPAEQLVSYYES